MGNAGKTGIGGKKGRGRREEEISSAGRAGRRREGKHRMEEEIWGAMGNRQDGEGDEGNGKAGK